MKCSYISFITRVCNEVEMKGRNFSLIPQTSFLILKNILCLLRPFGKNLSLFSGFSATHSMDEVGEEEGVCVDLVQSIFTLLCCCLLATRAS